MTHGSYETDASEAMVIGHDAPMPIDSPPTDRTRVRRKAERGRYDRATVDAILDEALLCHVGFAVDGHPWVLPTAFARIDDHVYLHGATGNFALRALADGVEACVTVTLIDGLVLSRSAFHHSMNYRSVMIFGTAEAVRDETHKRKAVMAILEHLIPGRSSGTREPTPQELRSTLVVRLPVDEVSAKVRTGPPIEEPDDLSLEHWAGELPLALTPGAPIADDPARAMHGAHVPEHVREWSRTDES
jgi:nitroimidazol reductase NimA-like FMN-containing flavoprotein (pyridoxamine 5'-phosphate oxidase superfamily)